MLDAPKFISLLSFRLCFLLFWKSRASALWLWRLSVVTTNIPGNFRNLKSSHGTQTSGLLESDLQAPQYWRWNQKLTNTPPSGHRGWGRYLYSGIARVSASGSGVVIIWGMFRVRPFTTFWSTSSTVSSGASATPLLQLSEDQTKKQRLDFRYWPPPSRAFTAETPKVSLKLFQKRFPKGLRNAVTLRIFIRLHLFVFYGLKRKPPGV